MIVRTGSFGVCALALTVLWCSACGGSLPHAPRHPLDDKAFAAPILAKRGGVADDRPPPLVLLPGDRVNIEMISAQTTVIPNVLIEPAGTIHLPLAGDVEVKGLGLVAAEAKITQALKRYDSLIHVTLTVATLDGHKVTVGGAVRTPGVVPLTPAARLADVIMAAGGTVTNLVNGQLVSGSDLRSARLIRQGQDVPVDFEKAMTGDPLHNVYMNAGDQVSIPSERGLTISVMGQTNGTVVQWSPGVRLTEVLAMSGGIQVGGDKSDIRIVRGPIDATRVYTTSIRDVIDGYSHDVELYPGDVVFVTDHWIEDFGEVVNAIAPIISLSFSAAALAIALEDNTATVR
ncbi:MAG TPA: polysaccharide biosynthesis/export family protein [Polyangiales bacterium]|nr:polysaccharide biosynthesis/export family protein [Polyangiales bacterium]